MSYPKVPTASYDNLGGINEKVSKYMTGVMEFLNLVNFDLNVPGAITKRPGFTQFLFAGTSGTVTNIHEYARLSGFSQIVVSANTGLYFVNSGRTLTAIKTSLTNNQYCDMQTFVDWLWVCNGQTYFRWDGATAYPHGIRSTPQNSNAIFGSTAIGQSTGFFMYARYTFGYVNKRGFYGPAKFYGSLQSAGFGLDPAFINVSKGGASEILLSGYTASDVSAGISYIAIYRNDDAFSASYGLAPSTGIFYLLDLIPTSQATYVDTWGDTSLISQERTAPGDFIFYNNFTGSPGSMTLVPRIPKMLEIHQNSMFMAGFSITPSNLWFSDIGNPEAIEPDFNFEVRTNDGDRIRAIKSFGSQLIVLKENSFHKVVGDNPDNYELVEISTEFGCISDRAVVAVKNHLYFLDVKGICEYNGSDWGVISDKLEPTFRRMNITAARDQAVAIHYDFRNQIWFGIPVDGSTVNNLTIVYDYKANAWMKYEGFNPSAFGRCEGPLNTKTVFMGNYSGMVHHFSPSFLADNGTAMTLIAQPRFVQPQGRNVEALFRRLWLDVEPVTGLTGTVNVTLTRDMSNTGLTTMPVYQSQFQSRLEIGVQAKSMGFIFSHRHASLPCQINGWVIAHRWLRDV